jgi:hypothetical protein
MNFVTLFSTAIADHVTTTHINVPERIVCIKLAVYINGAE